MSGGGGPFKSICRHQWVGERRDSFLVLDASLWWSSRLSVLVVVHSKVLSIQWYLLGDPCVRMLVPSVVMSAACALRPSRTIRPVRCRRHAGPVYCM